MFLKVVPDVAFLAFYLSLKSKLKSVQELSFLSTIVFSLLFFTNLTFKKKVILKYVTKSNFIIVYLYLM